MAEKIPMLALSPTMEKGKIAKWKVKEGELIKEGTVLCDVETDKTTMEYESMNEGVLLKIITGNGEKASVGDIIAICGEKGENIDSILKEINKNNEKNETEKIIKKDLSVNIITENKTDRIKISPLARKIANEKGIRTDKIKGSGPGGRIIKSDVENYRGNNIYEEKYEDKKIEISEKRKVIAERLSKSKYTSPHFYLTVSVDMTNILNTRNDSKEEKININAFIIKLVSKAIEKYTLINSTWENNFITVHGSVDISLAVAQKDGLITPVVRNTQKLGIKEINEKLKYLIEKARNNSLDPEEYSDSTFTVSNLGSYGIEEFTAIINPPGSAILAVGKTIKTAVVNEATDEITIKPMMKITLSCDHRVIDGAYGAEFLNYLKKIMENPIISLM